MSSPCAHLHGFSKQCRNIALGSPAFWCLEQRQTHSVLFRLKYLILICKTHTHTHIHTRMPYLSLQVNQMGLQHPQPSTSAPARMPPTAHPHAQTSRPSNSLYSNAGQQPGPTRHGIPFGAPQSAAGPHPAHQRSNFNQRSGDCVGVGSSCLGGSGLGGAGDNGLSSKGGSCPPAGANFDAGGRGIATPLVLPPPTPLYISHKFLAGGPSCSAAAARPGQPFPAPSMPPRSTSSHDRNHNLNSSSNNNVSSNRSVHHAATTNKHSSNDIRDSHDRMQQGSTQGSRHQHQHQQHHHRLTSSSNHSLGGGIACPLPRW